MLVYWGILSSTCGAQNKGTPDIRVKPEKQLV